MKLRLRLGLLIVIASFATSAHAMFDGTKPQAAASAPVLTGCHEVKTLQPDPNYKDPARTFSALGPIVGASLGLYAGANSNVGIRMIGGGAGAAIGAVVGDKVLHKDKNVEVTTIQCDSHPSSASSSPSI